MPAGLNHVPLLELRTRLRQSFWFIPLLMLGATVGLAALTLWIDWNFDLADLKATSALAWIQLGGAEGARAMLTSVATAIMTVVGVIFSVTIAVLTLTTSQFGPRLLRAFIADRANQAVLGAFLATFFYCLLISLTIGDGDEDPLPRLSILVGAGMAAASVLVFVFFVHHVARSIQADEVVDVAACELDEVIDAVYGPPGEAPSEAQARLPGWFDDEARAVRGRVGGYVTSVDLDRLIHIARERDLVLEVDRRPGSFVAVGDALLRAGPGARVDERTADRLRRCLYLGEARTTEQDLEFALQQLVEIALRAMSTGINDPFTAVRCVDRLEAALRRLCGLVPPPAARHDERGALRVVMPWIELPRAIVTVFEPLRIVAPGAPQLTRRLLEALRSLAREAPGAPALAALRHQLEGLRAASASFDDTTGEDVRRLADEVAAALEGAAARLEAAAPARA
ncbi:MAG: DUF2254 domain-containing protein [Planctomycetes bacterium]|nr:DUF2254 domain-containing protein [Planctomycetota bacterium]